MCPAAATDEHYLLCSVFASFSSHHAKCIIVFPLGALGRVCSSHDGRAGVHPPGESRTQMTESHDMIKKWSESPLSIVLFLGCYICSLLTGAFIHY